MWNAIEEEERGGQGVVSTHWLVVGVMAVGGQGGGMRSILLHHWTVRPLRLVLTLLGLALASATLFGIVVASHNARRSYQRLNQSSVGRPAIDVGASDGSRFRQSELESMAHTLGRPVPALMLFRATTLRFRERKLQGLALGTEVRHANATAIESFGLAGLGGLGSDECLVSQATADALGVVEGDAISCLFRKGLRKFQVRAVVLTEVWSAFAEEPSLILPIEVMQKLSGLEGRIDRGRFFLGDKEAAYAKRVQAELNGAIATLDATHAAANAGGAASSASGLRATVRTGRVEVSDDLLRSSELGLSFAGFLALMMSGYILLNTTRMMMAERRKHFAILRCVGATHRQIEVALLVEMALFGLIAAAVGAALGAGFGWLIARVLGSVMGLERVVFELPWYPFFGILVAVPAVSLVVLAVALRQQRQVSPLECFREAPFEDAARVSWRQIGLGGVVFAGSTLGMFGIYRDWLWPEWGVPMGLGMLVAYLLLMPLGLVPLLRWLGVWATRRGWFAMEVSRYQLARRPDRTALNAGFLVIALCGALGLGQSLLNNVAELQRWYQRAFAGDWFLMRTGGLRTVADEEDPLRAWLRQEPSIAWSDAMRFMPAKVSGVAAQCLVREFPAEAPFPGVPIGMSDAEMRAVLDRGELVLSTVLAKRIRVRVGETCSLSLDGRDQVWVVGGFYTDFNFGGLTCLVKRSAAQARFLVTDFDLIGLTLRGDLEEGARVDARRRLEEHQSTYGFGLREGKVLREGIERAIQGVIAGVWAVVLMSFATGGIGIATTLAMNVVEQGRDFALLRLVGMTRRQIVGCVMIQAWLLALLGMVFGLIAGGTTVLVIHFCSHALLGYTPLLSIQLWLMVPCLVGTGLIVTLAGWGPARRASLIDPKQELFLD
jgi:putative ABC transport system permease protein